MITNAGLLAGNVEENGVERSVEESARSRSCSSSGDSFSSLVRLRRRFDDNRVGVALTNKQALDVIVREQAALAECAKRAGLRWESR